MGSAWLRWGGERIRREGGWGKGSSWLSRVGLNEGCVKHLRLCARDFCRVESCVEVVANARSPNARSQSLSSEQALLVSYVY